MSVLDPLWQNFLDLGMGMVNVLKFQTHFSLNVAYQGWYSQNDCLKCKQGRPWSDCYIRSSLIRVCAVCLGIFWQATSCCQLKGAAGNTDPWWYSKCFKISNTFFFLFSNKKNGYQGLKSQKACLNSNQGRPWSDCYFRSRLIWVCTVCLGLFGRQLVFRTFTIASTCIMTLKSWTLPAVLSLFFKC